MAAPAAARPIQRRIPPVLGAIILVIVLVAPTIVAVGADYAYARGKEQKTEIGALPSLRLAVRLNPFHGQYRETLASVLIDQYEEVQDPEAAEEAVGLYRQGIRFNHLDNDLYFGLAGAQYAIAKQEKSSMAPAEKSIARALRLQPYDPLARRLRARIYQSDIRYLKKQSH